jgi:hypothetical protein
MKNRQIFQDLFLPILLFVFFSYLANCLFYFQGGELIKDIRDSEFWLRNIKNGKFFDSNGSLYFDNLDRSREYKLEAKLKTYRDISFGGLELDGKPAIFQISSRSILHKNGVLANIYLISVKIGRSKTDKAVLTFNLLIPDGSPKIYILNNTNLVSAELSLSDTNDEVKRFVFTSVISVIIGFLIFLLLRSRVPKKIIAVLTGAGGLLASVFLMNVSNFRYVYVLAARRPGLYIFFFVIFICIVLGGYILYVSNWSKDGNPLDKKIKKRTSKNIAEQLSIFSGHWNKKEIYLIISLGLLLLIISAYTFSNDFYIDDYLWLRNYTGAGLASTFIGPVDATGCLPKYYRPLPLLFFQGQYKIFGETYVLYYLIRYFHLYLNCLLVYFIVKKITGSSFSAFCSGLWVAASVFSFSASAWLSSLFDVMMMTFALISVLILVSFKTRRGLFWAFAFLIASLMTKESSVMIPLVLLSAGFLFCADKMKKMIGFYIAAFVATGAYLLLRIRFWGGLGGMEDQYDFYSISNIPVMLARLGKILGLIFISPGTSFYSIENIAGIIIRSLFLAMMIFGVIFFLVRKNNFKLSPDIRLVILGFFWIIFLSLPILFPFTLIRLGYILTPGAAFVLGGAVSIINKNIRKRRFFSFLLISLAIVLSQQAVSHLRVGYEKYGKGAYFRDAKSNSLFKTWEKKLPEDARKRWLAKIEETK